jgi:ABC-type antimicrobial peptide transport system permease subunit
MTQVALSVMLTSASGMVAFALARHATLGRDEARKVLIAQVNFLPAGGDSMRVRALADQLIAGLAAIPGVQGASAAEFIQVRGRRRTVDAEIPETAGGTRHLVLDANAVAPSYFDVVGLSVLRGRDFEAGDARSGNPVVIVSKAMADALWPSADPIGKRITIDARQRSGVAEIIGVVADPIGQGPATAESFPGLLYLPMRPMAEAEVVLLVRAPEAQSVIAGQAAQLLRAEDARLVSPEVMTLDRYYERVVLPQRLIAQASGILAALQLLLAIAGLSGLVAYVTALRRREVGIRSALGAKRRDILGLVMRQGIRLTVIGGAIGVALSVVVGRVVTQSLPVTLPIAVVALFAAAGLFAITGAFAMWLPARRALDVGPAVALRVD